LDIGTSGHTLMAAVTLRDVEPSDLPALFSFQSDPESCEVGMVHPRSEAQFNEVWTKIFNERSARAAGGASSPDGPPTVAKAIIADGELCGSIGCFMHEGTYSVGYSVGRAHWGRGLASRAVALVLAEVPTRPMHALVAASNTRSLRVLLKNGFTITGRFQSPGTERYRACEEVSLVLA
jgi:RimJ/RimL family protein N-acetyltransferase